METTAMQSLTGGGGPQSVPTAAVHGSPPVVDGSRLSATHTAVPSLLSTMTLREGDLTGTSQLGEAVGQGGRQTPPPLAAAEDFVDQQEGPDVTLEGEDDNSAPIDPASLRLPRRRPQFVGGFAVAVDTTRRLILSASGLLALDDGNVISIDPITGEETALTAAQKAVVETIDSLQ